MRDVSRSRIALGAVASFVWLVAIAIGPVVAASPPAGPPFPPPEAGRSVYDYAGIFSQSTIAAAQATIDGIRTRTSAEIAVYTQDSGGDPTTDETAAKARALMDQWGVGRKGFDDGLVIFFDMQPNLVHGQVQLYAGPGFEAAFLSNAERQAIYENDMLPYLKAADFNGALSVALHDVDAAATPEHAASLQGARQANAVVGLVGAPVVLMGLSGWAFFHWRRFGKDPVYLDDPSVLMPAPPPDLTAASGAVIMDGATSRRALTTAMLDLASRGMIAFREDPGGVFAGHKVGIDLKPAAGDAETEGQRARNSRRPTGPAEELALRHLQKLGGSGDGAFISAEDLPKFGADVPAFDSSLESHVVKRGWFAEKPSKIVATWTVRGILAFIGGGIVAFVGIMVMISGLLLIGLAALLGGLVIIAFARAMPAVTMSGAMMRAMLAAYKRTLQNTMGQARSMQQVVDQAGLAWLDTPDQAVVWGTALGLQHEIEGVLSRSLDDVKAGHTTGGIVPYFPFWYQTSSGTPFMGSAGAGGSGGSLFSDSAIPDVGGMMSALGTIGNSPPSSSGGGGFGGGGSGGGGGAPEAASRSASNRACAGRRRYTPRMGAVETMEEFFEKLNGGDREGAVALMDEKTEMRVHVGDNVQTLRGVERVGGWFLRGDKGLRMIPGEIRDTGNTYEADLLVVRPGAQSQHIDATFRVEAGKITAINIAPR